jgi:hypothetical protein
MLDLGSWSFGRVMLVSALWMGLVVFAAVAGIYLVLRGSWSSAGSGGIGAVSGVSARSRCSSRCLDRQSS